jgi:hypothetical protein
MCLPQSLDARTLKTRLAIAVTGGQQYAAGRPRIEKGNFG